MKPVRALKQTLQDIQLCAVYGQFKTDQFLVRHFSIRANGLFTVYLLNEALFSDELVLPRVEWGCCELQVE